MSYGLSLDAIAQLVDADKRLTCSDVYRLAIGQLKELQRKSGPEDTTVVAFEKLIATCHRTGGRKDCQILAGLARDTG